MVLPFCDDAALGEGEGEWPGRDEHGGWDVFFFSTMTMTCHNTGVDSIKRIHSMTTAAYAMTRDTMQRLAVLPYSGGSVDVGFFSTLERCCFPKRAGPDPLWGAPRPVPRNGPDVPNP